MRHQLHFTLTLLLLLVASTASALTGDEAAATVTTRYRLTIREFFGGFTETGSVLTPRREGLRANSPSKLFKPNLVQNRQLTAAGGGDLPLGGAHDGTLKPGERLYLYGVRTGDDYVQLDLYTVATYVVPGTRGPTPLQASIRFQYDGGLAGMTGRQLLDDLAEWLDTTDWLSQSAGGNCPPAQLRAAGEATHTIQLGQTLADVTAILGPPEKQVLLGAKTIFVYPDLKVVFVNGKVADAE